MTKDLQDEIFTFLEELLTVDPTTADVRLTALKLYRAMGESELKETHANEISKLTGNPNTPTIQTIHLSIPKTYPPINFTLTREQYEELKRISRENKIRGIKYLREITGFGLKETKDFVDSINYSDLR